LSAFANGSHVCGVVDFGGNAGLQTLVFNDAKMFRKFKECHPVLCSGGSKIILERCHLFLANRMARPLLPIYCNMLH